MIQEQTHDMGNCFATDVYGLTDPRNVERVTAIPIPMYNELLAHLPYGSAASVMMQTLFVTGCRPCELDVMSRTKIKFGFIVWGVGKNQKGTRREFLGDKLLLEMKHYIEHNRVYGDKLFGINYTSLNRYFNRDIRPKLSKEWNLKNPWHNHLGIEPFVYQLKGFRKTNATLKFHYYYKKYNNAQVAAEFVSQAMKHSTLHMTFGHYLVESQNINAEQYYTMLPFEIASSIKQKALNEYCDV